MFTLKKSQTIAAVATTLALAGRSPRPRQRLFLKIDGTTASRPTTAKNEIVIESWSWGVSHRRRGRRRAVRGT